MDLRSIGDQFSWGGGGHRGTHHVQCCLDSTMENTHWLAEHTRSETEFLEIGESDH